MGHVLGEYYLGMNVAETQSADPDPVDTLRQQFDAWCAGLVGVPDAVRSEVIAPTSCRPGRPRDDHHAVRWQGSIVTESHTVSVARTAATGVFTIGSAVPVSAGVYEVTLSVGDVPASGEDTLEVRVQRRRKCCAWSCSCPAPARSRLAAGAHRYRLQQRRAVPRCCRHRLVPVRLCWRRVCGCDPVLGCDSIDFNQDNLFPDEQDIRDFLDVFAGGCGG